MKFIPTLHSGALALLLLTGAFERSAASEIAEEERAKIVAAVPERAAVEAASPRKLLVFSRAWGYKHTSIPYGEAALKAMADRTGVFQATITQDDSFFETNALSSFDAIVFNNTNNEIFLPENFNDLNPREQDRARIKDRRLKQNLVDFISGGKGLAVIHAGVASFRQWPEFGKIMGARFDNHPWNAGSTVGLRVEEKDHPLTRICCPDDFQITDEIYQFKEYSRENLRVLISLDTNRTNMSKGARLHRDDGDFALTWIKPYGRGRVFYCAFGHHHDVFWNPEILRLLMDGIQYTLGDLKAEDEPRQSNP